VATRSADVLSALNALLEEESKRLRASSSTLYVRDKHWSDEFRLAAMYGVKVGETMHGLLYPLASRQIVVGGELVEYIDHSKTSPDIPDAQLWETSNTSPLSGLCQARRRQMAAKLKLQNRGQVDAVLFVNYNHRVRFSSKKTEQALKRALRTLTKNLNSVQEALSTDDTLWLSEAARVVSPALSVVNINPSQVTLDDYFTNILKSTIDAFGIDVCLGTMHSFDAEEQALTLHGHFGDLQYMDRARRHSVIKGQGVVSWVARRQRALLIPDVSAGTSPFRSVHVWLNDTVRSELAIPVEAGGELIGVMCLESAIPGAFRPHHVRSAWYAANRAAIFYQLKRQTTVTAELLTLCSEATSGVLEAKTALKRLAELARDYLKASYSDISCFSPVSGEFLSFAASDGDFVTRARGKGWTEVCRRARVPIWISDAESISQFSIQHWIDGQWRAGPPDVEIHPKDLNAAAFDQGVRCQLGVPLVVRGECVGVAWIRYKRPRMQPPQLGLMTPALGFAAHGALVLQSIIDSSERKHIDGVAQAIADEMRTRWESQTSGLLELYPLTKAYRARQGGDL
jgi:GAF domain-containing protein